MALIDDRERRDLLGFDAQIVHLAEELDLGLARHAALFHGLAQFR